MTETDRDKYCVRRIIDFYKRHRSTTPTTFWRPGDTNTAPSSASPAASCSDFASEAGLSEKYLAAVDGVLNENWPEAGPLGQLAALWRKLPADVREHQAARRDCEQMRDLVVRLRNGYEPKVAEMRARGIISPGSQPFVLWRARQLAAKRMRPPGESATRDVQEFCRVFPDAFVVSDRPPYFDLKGGAQGRPLSAGFHLMQGYFRDDAPLCELVLDQAKRRELDVLWRELNFVTGAPLRQYRDFIFFERAEPPRYMRESAFDFARSEDKDSISELKIRQLRDAYLAKARRIGGERRRAEGHRDVLRRDLQRRSARSRTTGLRPSPCISRPCGSLPSVPIAGRFHETKATTCIAFYRSLREKDSLSHEDAIRDTVASVLLSPHVAYRIDQASPGARHAAASKL